MEFQLNLISLIVDCLQQLGNGVEDHVVIARYCQCIDTGGWPSYGSSHVASSLYHRLSRLLSKSNYFARVFRIEMDNVTYFLAYT